MEIILKWNEAESKWHMMFNDEEETFIQEFYNCENLQQYFDKPSKGKRNYYLLRKPIKIPQGE